MELSDRIFIAGHNGMVGRAITNLLKREGYNHLILKTRKEADLRNQSQVQQLFEIEQPDYVFIAAAKVGGIYANNTFRGEFIYDNVMIQTNIIHAAKCAGVKRLIFFGSACTYPRICPQPMKEEYLLSNYLEPTNQPYAIAKLAGIEMCSAYNKQYGCQFLGVIPTNLYGPGDNYDPQRSHVIPALIKKFFDAKQQNHPSVTVWGTGKIRREFLYSEDLAMACYYLMNLSHENFEHLCHQLETPLINVGYNEDISIAELVVTIKKIVGYKGNIKWDISKPDGAPRKYLDSSRINAMGWMPNIHLENGIALAYKDFRLSQICREAK
jgi:GDP-L-fucose synthase